ncbi:HAD family hydrolase [Rhodoferax antarcticus]|uniref:HAD family hydrolase n=1 Tax=Rhodoferax antarcticus TaxID=81479 RepID=UPI0022251747|nr:HAD family hydrolase [Rhodoferax antarcticus]MCW2312794.1 phosphoglycolate phosphatase [Rhodoferax antarcticus]
MPSIQNVIFDLDGTLIDSSASILASYNAAFECAGLTPVLALTADIIGPPLRPTLQMLSGSSDTELLNGLTRAFIAHYDSTGYRYTTVFEGVDAFLRELAEAAVPLFIVTNKRIAPTKLILDYLGWAGLFQGAYALDSWGSPLPSKEAVIRRTIELHSLQPDATLYVGDRDDDRFAAEQAGVAFFLVPWGYGMCSPTNMDEVQDSTFGWKALRLHSAPR